MEIATKRTGLELRKEKLRLQTIRPRPGGETPKNGNRKTGKKIAFIDSFTKLANNK